MKKIKWFLASFAATAALTPIAIIGTASCGQTKFNDKKEVKMVDENNVEILTTNLLYKQGSTLALIGLHDGFTLVEKMHAKYVYDEVTKFTITKENGLTKVTRENGATCFIDTYAKTFTFNDYVAFIAEGTSKPSDMIRDYGGYKKHGEEDVKFVAYGDLDVRVKSQETTVFDLDAYNIPMYTYNGEIYIPLQTLSDMFLADINHPVCALKNIIVPVDALPTAKIGESPTYPEHIKDNAMEVTQELLDFNYCETCFYFDNFYGLRDNKHIESFDTLFKSNSITIDGKTRTLKECMLTSVELVDEAINWICGYICDDGHTRYFNRSPSNPNASAFTRYESVGRQFMDTEKARYVSARAEAFPSGYKKYNLATMTDTNDTAIIRFDRFDPIPNDFDKRKILDDPNKSTSAIQLFTSAYKQIADTSKNINNVIVDLSCNGGGDVRFGVWLASMLSGGVINGAHCYTVDNSINLCSYYSDCNLDGKINSDDWALKNKNVYVLTSRYSFSCANLLPTLTFSQPNVKVIGKTSGGGGCFVYPQTNVFATKYRISGAFQSGYIKNGVFYTNDTGIEPEFFVPDSKYYNDEQLCAYIKNYQ